MNLTPSVCRFSSIPFALFTDLALFTILVGIGRMPSILVQPSHNLLSLTFDPDRHSFAFASAVDRRFTPLADLALFTILVGIGRMSSILVQPSLNLLPLTFDPDRHSLAFASALLVIRYRSLVIGRLESMSVSPAP